MKHSTVVTTSWDDGDPKDLRIADLLRSRAVSGTFYVPIKGYRGATPLGHSDLRVLCSEDFEVGAHSVSHRSLTEVSKRQLASEVRDCKEALEQVVGREVLMFCYPNGRYNHEVIRQVRDAGYKGARTCRMLSIGANISPFQMPTTIQAYPHGRLAYVRNVGRGRSVGGLLRVVTEFRRLGNWIDLGRQLFDYITGHGGIWHLYGHSWEIEEMGLWSDLAKLLDYVSHHDGVSYLTNGQLLSLSEAAHTSEVLKRH